MQHWRSSNSAQNQSNILKRVLHSLKLMLLSRFYRLAGWGVVVGLPTMILTPRRFAGLVRGYPIVAGTICLALLIGVAIWNEGNRPRPAEFEIESIDNIGEPNELIAISSPRLIASADFRPDKSADPLERTATIETRLSLQRKPEMQVRVEQAALRKPQTDTQSIDATRIVWLTGSIEEFASGGPAKPVRNAVRLPSNRR